MKKKSIVSLLYLLIVMAGCHGPGLSGEGSVYMDKVEFPVFLVGTWLSDESNWVFKFEPDGSISKMRHFIGATFIVEEGGLTEEGRGGMEATYILGPCETDYDADTRQLKVDVAIEYYILKFDNGSMEGTFYDTLTGVISQDGEKWFVSWISIGEIFGGDSMDKDKVVPKELTFIKTADDFQF